MKKYKEMRPTTSQPSRPFATMKMHKFTDIKQMLLIRKFVQ